MDKQEVISFASASDQMAALRGFLFGPYSMLSRKYGLKKNVAILIASLIATFLLLVVKVHFSIFIMFYTFFAFISFFINSDNIKRFKRELSITVLVISVIACAFPAFAIGVINDHDQYSTMLQDTINQDSEEYGVSNQSAEIAVSTLVPSPSGVFYTTLGPYFFVYLWAIFSFLLYLPLRTITKKLIPLKKATTP